MRNLRIHTIRQRIDTYMLQIWQNILSGKGWTFVFLLWVGAIVACLLHFTVFFRPIEQVMKPSRRMHHSIIFWIDYGFFKHGGLTFSESPEVNPNALVYKSRAPAYMYPLYIANVLNYWRSGQKFSLRLYVLYNQVLLWFSAACLGFLGVRLAKRLGSAPLLALVCGITGQIIFHTFPYNLDKYFEVYPIQFLCLFMVWLFIVEDLDLERSHQTFHILRGLCLFLLIYFDKAHSLPGLGTYFLALILLNNTLPIKKIVQLLVPMFLGVAFHGIQLGWVKLRFPQISFVGATFLWRSGLDGATNHVGILTPDQLGADNVFLRNIGLLALVLILWFFLRGGQRILKFPMLLAFTAIGFYVVPGYLFSQALLIHPYVFDIFLASASILIFCYILVPYLENKTGNTGVITWILVIVGFCLCMYQLRLFAVHYPLPIPEPNWRVYRLLG